VPDSQGGTEADSQADRTAFDAIQEADAGETEVLREPSRWACSWSCQPALPPVSVLWRLAGRWAQLPEQRRNRDRRRPLMPHGPTEPIVRQAFYP